MTGSEPLFNESLSTSKPDLDFTDSCMKTFNLSRSQVPPSAGFADFDKTFPQEFKSLNGQDRLYKQLMPQASQNGMFPDPCSIPDDLRDELMRQKRKDDAFKTALCDSYRRNQECSYGNQCRFAHGVHELRLPQNPRGRNHPKYKTVLCDKFSTTGTCKYGTRCQFIHKMVANPQQGATNGVMNKASSTLNQSLLMPSSIVADLSMDFNQSLPIRHSDLARAFVRSNQMDESLRLMSRAFETHFSRGYLPSDIHN